MELHASVATRQAVQTSGRPLGRFVVRDALRHPFSLETSTDEASRAPSGGVTIAIQSPFPPVSAGGTCESNSPVASTEPALVGGSDTTRAGATRGGWMGLPGIRRSECMRSSARWNANSRLKPKPSGCGAIDAGLDRNSARSGGRVSASDTREPDGLGVVAPLSSGRDSEGGPTNGSSRCRPVTARRTA
jgi:hypothetical protein